MPCSLEIPGLSRGSRRGHSECFATDTSRTITANITWFLLSSPHEGLERLPLSGSFVLLPWPWRSQVGFFPCAGVTVDDIELRVAPSFFTDDYGCFLGDFSLNANNINLHRVRSVFAGVHGVNGLVLPAFGDVGGTGCFPVMYYRDLFGIALSDSKAPVRDSRSTNARSEELEARYDKDEALSITTDHEPEFLSGTMF